MTFTDIDILMIECDFNKIGECLLNQYSCHSIVQAEKKIRILKKIPKTKKPSRFSAKGFLNLFMLVKVMDFFRIQGARVFLV
jgi:hypothetical protein